MHDPILEMLAPEVSQTALVINDTSMDVTRENHSPDVCRTGKDNWDQVRY